MSGLTSVVARVFRLSPNSITVFSFFHLCKSASTSCAQHELHQTTHRLQSWLVKNDKVLLKEEKKSVSLWENSTGVGWVMLFTEQGLQQAELGFEALVLAVLLRHGSTVLLLTGPVKVHGGEEMWTKGFYLFCSFRNEKNSQQLPYFVALRRQLCTVCIVVKPYCSNTWKD